MRKYLLIFLLAFLSILVSSVSYSGYIEFNPVQEKIKLIDFNLGGHLLSGDFNYRIQPGENQVVFFLEGSNLSLGQRKLDAARLTITKRGDILFIDSLDSLNFSGQGNFNLKKKSFRFDLQGSWHEDAEFLKGEVSLDVKAWGDFDNFLVSGNLVVLNGIYQDMFFESLRCNFLGKPPIFHLTDVKVVLPDRGVFELIGRLDIRDPDNFFPSAELISQSLFLQGWKIFADEQEVGLRRQIDDKFDIRVVEADIEKESGAELRYNLERDNFLKLRMKREETILGIERKREF